MSYSFGFVPSDLSVSNLTTGASVSAKSTSVDVTISKIQNLPVQVADNVIYIDSVTGIISRNVPVGGGSTGATGATGASGVTGGVNWADYLYWDSVNGVWAVGDTNVIIGSGAGQTNQGASAIAIGYNAASVSQDGESVAIGCQAGYNFQKFGSVAVGTNAAAYSQGAQSIAIGSYAGQTQQGGGSVAIGTNAGAILQQDSAIAIGSGAGNASQGLSAIAIGSQAGYNEPGGAPVGIDYNCITVFLLEEVRKLKERLDRLQQ